MTRPKFAVGELVRIASKNYPEANGHIGEITRAYFIDGLAMDRRTGEVAPGEWNYTVKNSPCCETTDLWHESALRKLPPDQRLSWDQMMDDLNIKQGEPA